MDTIIHLIAMYRYLILFPLAVVEGPIISFLAGMFAAQGFLNPFIAFGILMLGDIIPDSTYFYIGWLGREKELVVRGLAKVGLSEKHMGAIRKMWHTHPKKTMFFCKLAYGLSTPLLISAGLVKMSYKKFVTFALIVTLAQFGILMSLGYYFSSSLKVVVTSYKDLGYVVAAIIVIWIGYYFISRRLREQFLAEEALEEKAEEKPDTTV